MARKIPKKTLGIIGAGAFGSLMAKHLAPHFDLVICDRETKKAAALARKCRARAGSLREAAGCGIVVLAVPVQQFGEVLPQIARRVQPGALVIDVASIKLKPAKLMKKTLPKSVDIVGTHPLFGPQSGKNGIRNLNIAVCDVRGNRAACVRRFCRNKLGLRVFAVTPDAHDRELAYVQGLTHLIAKVVVALDLPRFKLTTRTYNYMDQMVEMVRYDSDELFRAIERENPYTELAKRAFFKAARALEKRLRRRR